MTDIWFLHNRVRIPISGAATDGAFALLEVSGPPGDQPPLHVHHDHDEGFYVLEGELTLWVGDAVHVLRAGDASSRRAACRTPCAPATRGGRWLVTSTPAGFEAFVRAVGLPDPRTRAARPDGADAHRRASTASRSSARPGCSRAS